MKNEGIEPQRESKILSMMNVMNAFMWYCDLRDGILRFGEGAEKLGIVPSEMDGLFKFGDRIHPDYREQYVRLMTDFCRQESGEFTMEYPIDLLNSGDYQWWECRSVIETVEENGVSYRSMYGMDINIDRQKKSELDILRSKMEVDLLNRKNQIMLNNTNTGLIFFNNDYSIEWENMTKLFPTHPFSLNCKKGTHCYSMVKGLSEPCEDCIIEKSILSGKIEVTEVPYDGNKISEFVATPIYEEGTNHRIGSVLKIVDITEEKRIKRELEEAKIHAEGVSQVLKNILDCLPCLLFIKDIEDDYRHVMINRKFSQLIGLPEEEILGKTDFDLYDVKFANQVHSEDQLVTTEGQLYTFEEETWFHGKHIVWQTTKTVISTVDGHRFVLGVSSDISEKIRSYNELQEAKEKADEANRLKSAFLANMSHEIRTPLNSIVGFSELIMKMDSEEEKEEYCKIIRHNNELLLRLIGDILDLSKIEAGMMEFAYEKFDLSELFKELYLNFKQRLASSRIRLVVTVPYEVCNVVLDRNRVVQVLSNFLTNAIKFTPSGEIRMGYEYENGKLMMFVSDTGIGIAPDKVDLVFERFEKLDEFAQGTGLGMAICKAIVVSFGGDITLESKEGEGTIFRVFIPIEAEIVQGVSEEEKVAPGVVKILQPKVAGKTILVAEDNDSNYLLLQHMLKDHSLERACNGVEAVEAAKTKRYDIILMDVKMPLLDGIEATREIRTFDTETPIYAVTAHAYSASVEEATAAGCTGYITKPIAKEILLKVINQL